MTAVFIGLIVAFGAILGWYNYNETSKLLLEASEEAFDQVQQELSLDYRGTYRPVATAVIILSATDLVDAQTLEERLQFLPLMQAALSEAPHLSGLEVGYPNGDYFIVRPLAWEYMRLRFHPPPDAAFVVDHITTANDGDRRLLRIWYDRTLRELDRVEPEPTAYDPRVRPWYTIALDKKEIQGTDPYLFHFIDQIGFTISYQARPAGAVVAGDVTLIQLSETLSRHQMTERSEILVLSAEGQVVAYRDPEMLRKQQGLDRSTLPAIKDLKSEVLGFAWETISFDREVVDFHFQGERWLGGVRELENLLRGKGYYLAMLSPEQELMAQAIRIQVKGALIILGLVALTIPVSVLMARLLATPLRKLAVRAKRLSHFDFSLENEGSSGIKEVNELSLAMGMMQTTIAQFTLLINSLASEQDFDALLETITGETMRICMADAVVAYLVDESGQSMQPVISCDQEALGCDIHSLVQVQLTGTSPLAKVLESGKLAILQVSAGDDQLLGPVLSRLGHQQMDACILPLRNRQGEGVGILCLLYRRGASETATIDRDRVAFAEAISGFAAVTLESRKMLKMQKELLDAFVVLLAGAIDAKSPYTGGHCQRVPVLTKLLARKACECTVGTFADFQLDYDQWEALHIAAWLHDCGKVTTPEYVVDKATKLETIYDRLHEIRMRFEVLKRDAHIRFWQQVVDGADREACAQELHAQWEKLDEEFAFVASCNQGGEFFIQEDLLRLQQIAKRTWQRTLDDRIGLGWEELQRKQRSSAQTLPVTEHLLADKEEHLVERPLNQQIASADDYGFFLDTPKYLYNRGECYNLSVQRGTLTREERYQINDHIVQTIIMLKKLPYPKHLQEVPDIAGSHHEKMDGTGYPRRLAADQLSIPARMMAIADIFEALTASDRPYKRPKKLSEVMEIMGRMAQEHHIDRDLFRLFLVSGAFREYAEKYLLPEQIDHVDAAQYLAGKEQ